MLYKSYIMIKAPPLCPITHGPKCWFFEKKETKKTLVKNLFWWWSEGESNPESQVDETGCRPSAPAPYYHRRAVYHIFETKRKTPRRELSESSANGICKPVSSIKLLYHIYILLSISKTPHYALCSIGHSA